jgi:flagellar FliL protein
MSRRPPATATDRDDSPEAGPTAPATGKRKGKEKGKDDATGKGGTVKAIGLAVGFAVLGAVVGPKLLGGGGAAPAGAAEDTTTTTEAGPVVVLDAVTLNLADGHLLQVGLALELAPDAAGGGHDEAADDDPTKGYAKALDAAIDVLGDQSMASLSAPGGREGAKAALTATLGELYAGSVVGVYFHEFVMQ